MRKLLSLFMTLSLISTTTTSVIACGNAPKGETVATIIYNGTQDFSLTPQIKNTISNGVYDANKSAKDELDSPFELGINGGKIGLVSNVLMPFMTGLNLSKDNTSSKTGAKWSPDQIAMGLEAKKENILANAGTSKTIWEEFFEIYSTSDDSYYTQVGIVAKDNPSLIDPLTNNIVTKTANFEKTADPNWVNTKIINNVNVAYTPDSLQVLSPIARAINWLNDDTNGFSAGITKIDQNRVVQSARYAVVDVPNVSIKFAFKSGSKVFNFSTVVEHVTGFANYLVYKDVKAPAGTTKYAHQWFFISYGFFNPARYTDDDYHYYNWQNIPGLNARVALGFAKAGKPQSELTEDEDKNVGDDGKFKAIESSYSFADLSWTIKADSITKST